MVPGTLGKWNYEHIQPMLTCGKELSVNLSEESWPALNLMWVSSRSCWIRLLFFCVSKKEVTKTINIAKEIKAFKYQHSQNRRRETWQPHASQVPVLNIPKYAENVLVWEWGYLDTSPVHALFGCQTSDKAPHLRWWFSQVVKAPQPGDASPALPFAGCGPAVLCSSCLSVLSGTMGPIF